MFKCTRITIALLVYVACEKVEGFRLFHDEEGSRVLAQKGEKVTLVCQDDVPLIQCGFTRPNGSATIFPNLRPGTAECVTEFEASSESEGSWTCHIWPQNRFHRNKNKTIHVRTVGKIAPLMENISVKEGSLLMLICVTTERMIPIDNCVFTSPNGDIMAIRNEPNNVKFEDRYEIPLNRSMDRGDCAITLKRVLSSDSGLWSCRARIEHDLQEYQDFFYVSVVDEDKKLFSLYNNKLAELLIIVLAFLIVALLYYIITCYKRINVPILNKNATKCLDKQFSIQDKVDDDITVFVIMK